MPPAAVSAFFGPLMVAKSQAISRNFERLEGAPWVHRMGFFVEAGDIIEPVTNHTKRAGFVITKGATRAEAGERAEEAVREIVIETRPVEGVST